MASTSTAACCSDEEIRRRWRSARAWPAIAQKAGGRAQRDGKPRASLVLARKCRGARNARRLEAPHGSAAREGKTGALVPHRDGDGGKPGSEADAPADSRRLRQARRDRAGRPSRGPAAAARGRAEQSPGLREVAGQPGKSAAGARHHESLLADVLRHRHRQDHRRLRLAGRMAVASRTARLAGHRIHPQRLGHEGDAEADRHQRRLPAVVESHAGTGGARSGKSPAGARPALPPARRNDSRPGALRRRAAHRKDRRAFRQAVSAGRSLEGAVHAGYGLRPEQGRPISIAAASTFSGSAPSRRP